MSLTVAEIAQRIGAEIAGDAGREISGLGSLGTAQAGDISHLSSPSYRHLLPGTGAGAVILKGEDAADCPTTALVVSNPYLAFARVSQLFVRAERMGEGIHPSAVLGQRCEIDSRAAIAAGVVIGDDTHIGPGVRIMANSVIGDRCRIAEDVTLRANVTLYNDITIGPRSVLHSGCVIGAAGFGFTPD